MCYRCTYEPSHYYLTAMHCCPSSSSLLEATTWSLTPVAVKNEETRLKILNPNQSLNRFSRHRSELP